MCMVSNNRPSSASSASFTLEGIYCNVSFSNNYYWLTFRSPTSQDGPTSITVAWTPPDPLDGITGYTISYTGGGSSDSEAVSGASTNSYTLTDLTNRQTYTISIVAIVPNSPTSAPVEVRGITLG